MSQFKNLNELISLAQNSAKTLDVQLQAMDGIMREVIRNVPEHEKAEVERVQGLMQRVQKLAMSGNIQEATELIKQFQDGRKNNRQTV